MNAITSTPGALRLFAISILARLPLTMLSIGLLVHAEHLTGSFAAAGIVAGAYAVSLGIGGPLLGQLIDRRGQTGVLVVSGLVSAAFLVAIAMLPVGASVLLLVGLATGTGVFTPPLGSCLRTLFPSLMRDAETVRAAYAVEATASELTWIGGPPIVLAAGALWSTGGAIGAAGIALLVGTLAFAAEPVSRAWRPQTGTARKRGGAMRAPAIQTLVVVLVAVGLVFGAVEVAVAAAADGLGTAAAAGPLLGLWGAGSLVGGIVAVRFGAGLQGAAGLTIVLGALTVGHLALTTAAGSLVALGAVLVVAGASIAPTYALVYAMVDRAAPEGTATEAFAWLNTAVAIGAAGGAAVAGALADTTGPAAAFAVAGVAGLVALVVALLRSGTLGGGAVGAPEPAAA
jgi:MFS family permease